MMRRVAVMIALASVLGAAGVNAEPVRGAYPSANVQFLPAFVALLLLCGCQVANTRVLFFLVTLSLPDQRETCCYTWHGTGPSHFFAMRSL